jgi:Ca2+-binding EF-hand superfamily protein
MGATASGLENLGECCSDRGYEKDSENYFDDDPRLEGCINSVSESLFRQFDMDSNQFLDNKQELSTMMQELRLRGYIFTGDDRTVIQQMLMSFDSDGSGRISARDFAEWFKLEVMMRRENLRTLLFNCPWVNAVIVRLHKDADEDKSGNVSQKELRRSIRTIYKRLGEPPPSTDEILETVSEMMACSDDGDGELNLHEFRQALIELMVKLYYSHFNESMNNPWSMHNVSAIQEQQRQDRDFDYHRKPVSSCSGRMVSLPQRVAEQRRLREAKDSQKLGQISDASTEASPRVPS